MFKSAKDNGLIDKHPMDGVRFTSHAKASDEIHYLTIEGQDRFLLSAKESHNYNQYALILETGLRTGMPSKNSSYDTHLYKICDSAGIERFCMHALRHTYATRAIERGVPPKALQKLLGHSSIKTTMDKYVHASDDYLFEAVDIYQGKTPQKGE